MPEPVEISLAKSLGSLEAQVRELIHDNNGRTQRDESVALSLARLQEIPKTLEKMEKTTESWRSTVELRMRTLEDDLIRKNQNASLLALFLKSPAVGWIVGIVSAAAVYLFGRSQ